MAEGQSTVVITDDNFEAEIGRAAGPAVVDFGAAWCAPCRVVGPVVEQLAGEYQGRIKVGTLDVDENQRTAARFGIRNLPTFLFFRDGAVVDRVVGAVPRALLEGKIRELAEGEATAWMEAVVPELRLPREGTR